MAARSYAVSRRDDRFLASGREKIRAPSDSGSKIVITGGAKEGLGGRASNKNFEIYSL